MTTVLTRRTALGVAAAALAAPPTIGRAQARALQISHQFPGSNGDTGDFRDRLCHRFAEAVTRKTDGALTFNVYANSSLLKTFAQFSALRKGALDLGLVPTSYAGGEIPELNLTFMPAVVTSYAQGYAWKTAPIGEALTSLLESRGVKLISWVWQSGGIASRVKPLVEPADAAGLKVRGGSREMDAMFRAAGATVATMPSDELYIAMQTGLVDGAVTSSTSMISFRLQETSKHLTSASGRSFFFVLEPLLMSKIVFDSLPPAQQRAIVEAGEEMEPFGREAAQHDDAEMAAIYERAGVAVHQMDVPTLDRWRDVAARSSWKDFADRSESTARFLKLANAVTA
jgi:TRAP-type C4-dicarboxylate transport system substrate-binding protein